MLQALRPVPLVVALLCGISAFAADTSPTMKQLPVGRPKYAPTTVRALDSNDYVRKNDAPDFWAMIYHYVPQMENGCQTATMAMVINALRNGLPTDSDTKNVTQTAIIQGLKDKAWEKAMKAKKCYSMDDFSVVLQKALDLFLGKDRYAVRAVHVDSQEPAAIDGYRKDFAKNEASPKNFILVNFDQAVFTGEPESAGHLSPLGAYDAQTKRYLILDVDRDWYTPYWVPESEFFKAMGTSDTRAKKARGYLVIEPKSATL